MPLDRVITLRQLGHTLTPPAAGDFRTFGSAIGAGERDNVTGRIAEAPPWPSDPEDDGGFRDLVPNNMLSIFAVDAALLAAWTASVTPPIEWWLLSARELSQEVTEEAGTALAAMMVGRELQVGAVSFGDVTAATFVRRTAPLNTMHRHGYSRWDLTLDRHTPRTNFWDRGQPVEFGSNAWTWGYLDEAELRGTLDTTAWAEVLDLAAIDQLVVDVGTADTGGAQVDLLLRIRADVGPHIDTEAQVIFDGETYEVSSVIEDIEAGRGRFQRLACRRYEGIAPA